MKKILLLLFIVLLTYNCKSHKYFENIKQVYIENIDSDKKTNLNKFDIDNKIFVIGRKFRYKITHNKRVKNINNLKYIEYEIQGGTKPFSDIDSTYSKTVVKISYFNNENTFIISERTGIIENNINVWLHPPRSDIFSSLQLNAFPFLIFSDNEIKSWTWNLECSYNQFNNILVKHNYILKKYKSSNYDSYMESFIIKSVSNSEAGKSMTINNFNTLYGFYKMKFFNYDKSILTLDLISIKEEDGSYFFKK